ncbi:hypothetical protein ES706_00958 [subsurface metagenome]
MGVGKQQLGANETRIHFNKAFDILMFITYRTACLS